MKIDQISQTPSRLYLKDYTPPTHTFENLFLKFYIHESETRVTARMNVKSSKVQPLILNGENMKLVSLKVNDQVVPEDNYKIDAETLTLLYPPLEFTLETVVIINPEANKSCEGLYLSKGIFATQCEAEGFRNITYFMDRPDVMTDYTVEIEADEKKYPVLLSNGDLISKESIGHGRHKVLWKDPFKKPCYLFALVAGDLGVIQDNFVTASGKKVKLEIFASHGKQARCHFAMESLKKAMKWDETAFGLEYDLNQYMIVSIDDFNMGAMENKGLNIFNSRLVLADLNSATDTDFERIESVVGHEYFHNWTGNRVTCRNWFELSLKEGLTVFRDQEFSADMNSRSVQRIKDVDALRISQFNEDAGPNSHPVRPESCLAVDNFYTSTIYEKGSEVIRMMQTIVGRKGFRKGMDQYFKLYDGQAVTILDFADAIASVNQADFSQFKLWYSQAGTPTIEVIENYIPSQKSYSLFVRQSLPPTEKLPTAKPFLIPLKVGLLDSKGEEIRIKSKQAFVNSDGDPVLHLKDFEQNFVFEDVPEKPVLSLNRDFSAPIKIQWKATHKELVHLMKYDRDAFNRREACFKMTFEELRQLIKLGRDDTSLTEHQLAEKVNPLILDAYSFVVQDSKMDQQFKALLLTFPSLDLLAQDEEVLDPVLFKKAYAALSLALAKKLGTHLLANYEILNLVNSRGARTLKNRILRLLVDGQHPGATPLAEQQFKQSQTMTDKIGALLALNDTDSSAREHCLAAFHSDWKDDAVVFNKWLSLQGLSERPSTFTNAVALTQQAPFSLENPNNVYSLIGNLTENFYIMSLDPSGSYKWFADRIIEIDAKNPQLAARLCGSFNFVKKFTPSMKEAALQEVNRLLARTELSRNSRELLETCLK